MKVHGIKAENIKKLTTVLLELNGDNLIVSGQPAEGKTTLISLVWAALTKKDLGPKPVTAGKDSGFIEIKLGGEAGKTRTITVRRDYDADGTDRLKVKSSDGSKIGISDITRLIQSISFDPLEFYTRKGMDQVNMLLQLLGVNLGDIEGKRKNLYEERTAIGRVARAAREAVGAEPPRKERVSLVDLSKRLTEAQEYNRLVAERHAQLAALKLTKAESEDKVAQFRRALQEAEEADAKLGLRIAKGEEICAPLVPVDTAPITLAIQESETINRTAETHERWLSDSEKAKVHEERYKELEQAIETIDGEKEKLLGGAKWPVPGLSVDGDIVTFEGTPLVQTGEGKKLEVSFAIAAALNPELRICRIDGAESLGAKGREAILSIAKEKDMQVFMSRVTDGEAEEGEITIEEGRAVR